MHYWKTWWGQTDPLVPPKWGNSHVTYRQLCLPPQGCVPGFCSALCHQCRTETWGKISFLLPLLSVCTVKITICIFLAKKIFCCVLCIRTFIIPLQSILLLAIYLNLWIFALVQVTQTMGLPTPSVKGSKKSLNLKIFTFSDFAFFLFFIGFLTSFTYTGKLFFLFFMPCSDYIYKLFYHVLLLQCTIHFEFLFWEVKIYFEHFSLWKINASNLRFFSSSEFPKKKSPFQCDKQK